MGFLEEADVKKLLQDPELQADLVNAMIEDPAALDDLAEDIADKLSDQIEDDPELKNKLVQAAVASPGFRKKIVKKLIDDLG